jgi:hypothetical protein
MAIWQDLVEVTMKVFAWLKRNPAQITALFLNRVMQTGSQIGDFANSPGSRSTRIESRTWLRKPGKRTGGLIR